MGYGPVRYLPATDVRQVRDALQEFPIRAKAEAYDPKKAKAAKVYVPDHGPEELLEYFGWLLEFYQRAADQNEAVLLWIE
jgi:hypothetical protein